MLTFWDFIDGELIEIDLLRMRTQRGFSITEKILSYLTLVEGLHVCFVAVDAAAGFVEFEDRDLFVRGGFEGGEAAEGVGVEAFGTED